VRAAKWESGFRDSALNFSGAGTAKHRESIPTNSEFLPPRLELSQARLQFRARQVTRD
jgi:hypothetical protein